MKLSQSQRELLLDIVKKERLEHQLNIYRLKYVIENALEPNDVLNEKINTELMHCSNLTGIIEEIIKEPDYENGR